ncbi:hypothetical protein LXL04_001812 [Taraxacum kok-saghyz]
MGVSPSDILHRPIKRLNRLGVSPLTFSTPEFSPNDKVLNNKQIIIVNPDNIRVCSGPDFLPVNPSKVNRIYIPRKYKMLTKQFNWFQLKISEINGNGLRICQNRDSRHDCPVLANLEGELAFS